jgi:hypothetical protein
MRDKPHGGPPTKHSRAPGLRFMLMNLNPGVSRFNVLSFFVMQLACYLLSNFIMSFFSFLLKSQYYDVKPEDISSVTGLMGFYSHFICLFFDFALGTIMDVFGRKIPSVIGLFIAGVCLIVMPYGYYLYPTLLILR